MKQSIIVTGILITLLVLFQSTFTMGELLKAEAEYVAAQQELIDQQVKRHTESMAHFENYMCRCNIPAAERNASNKASQVSTAYGYRYKWVGFWMPTDQTAMSTYSDLVCHR